MNQKIFLLTHIAFITLFLNQQSVYSQSNDTHEKKMLSIGVRINNVNIDAINTTFSFPITFFWWNDSLPETDDLYSARRFWLGNPFVQIAPTFGKGGNSVQGRLGYIVLGVRGYPHRPNVYGYLWGDINYIEILSDKSYLFPGIGIGIRSSDWTFFPGMLAKAKNLWLDLYVGYLITNNEFSMKHTKSKNWTFGVSVDYTFRW